MHNFLGVTHTPARVNLTQSTFADDYWRHSHSRMSARAWVMMLTHECTTLNHNHIYFVLSPFNPSVHHFSKISCPQHCYFHNIFFEHVFTKTTVSQMYCITVFVFDNVLSQTCVIQQYFVIHQIQLASEYSLANVFQCMFQYRLWLSWQDLNLHLQVLHLGFAILSYKTFCNI